MKYANHVHFVHELNAIYVYTDLSIEAIPN